MRIIVKPNQIEYNFNSGDTVIKKIKTKTPLKKQIEGDLKVKLKELPKPFVGKSSGDKMYFLNI